MRSPRIAMAWTSGSASSTVTILPLVRTRSAGAGVGCSAEARAQAPAATEAIPITAARTKVLRCTIISSTEQAIEVAAENRRAVLLARAGGPKRAFLRVVERHLPAAREERRVGAEEQASGADDVQGPPEDGLEREPRIVLHPVVRARRIEVQRRALIGRHQRLAEEPGAEVGDDDGHGREP